MNSELFAPVQASQCLICAGPDLRLSFQLFVTDGPFRDMDEPAVRSFYRCAKCDFVQASLFGSERYQQYYASLNDFYYQLHDSDVARYEIVAQQLEAANVARVLDWGCGTGELLCRLSPEVEKFGIEPSVAASGEATKKGITIVSPADIESDALMGTFDAVTVIDVVEHVSNPIDLRQTVVRLLRKGGLLVLLTGDSDSPSARRLGPYWYYLHYGEHIAFFNRRSIARWLDPEFEHISFTPLTHHPLKLRHRFKTYAAFVPTWLSSHLPGNLLKRSPMLLAADDHMLVSARRRT